LTREEDFVEMQPVSKTFRLSPSDIAAVLIYFTDRKLLFSDPRRLHRALLVARENSPLLRKNFGFSLARVNPMSRSFDEALGILKLSRIVRMENTDYDRYIIDDKARQYIESEIIPNLADAERDELQRAAAIIRESCASNEPESQIPNTLRGNEYCPT